MDIDMWNFTATTAHGKTLHYSAPSREAARTKRNVIKRAPFVVATTAPSK